jgi:hypothetical protein
VEWGALCGARKNTLGVPRCQAKPALRMDGNVLHSDEWCGVGLDLLTRSRDPGRGALYLYVRRSVPPQLHNSQCAAGADIVLF